MPDSPEGSGLLFLPEVEAPPAAGLPRPVRERFQPLRAGIVNLWQYDDQELAFHDGRLILRGENGSGKSKALELLLPFLFDADLSPQRLDPFGGTSRTMEWNLLQDGRYESRVGYVWLELGRCETTALPVAEAVAADSVEVCWTLGCGLRASQRTRRVDAWYFLTSRRVGGGLDLLTPGRTPLLKEQLRQAIGTSGWIFDTGKDYREKLDQQLFGLGEDRFASLRHLLLQLRRPHLSEKLDPRTLAELLKESLPPLDRDRIGELSEGFERLEKDQQDLARAQAAAQGVGAFLQLYRDFARGLGRGRAGDVRQADSRYHKTAGDAREAQAEEERLDLVVADAGIRERLTHLRADLGKVEDERVRAAARLRRLGEAGLVALTLAAPPEDAPASWSLTRSLEVAREIERENDGVDLAPEAASRRANRLHERFRQLESELGADFRASLEQDEDLAVVRILYNGRDHDVAGLLAVLHDGIETRRALLAEHERELLRRFLLDEVGVHLRERLQRARALVAHMNELLESCRTASGLALRLAWEPAPEAPDQVRDVVRLLQTDLELLPDGERRRIEAFFLRRIEEARQQWETVPWRDHLLAALDYRSWYTFRIQRRSPDDGGWVDLTRRGHAASSGGEKAIALHLPLFAAAAAHYRSALPQAPRIILLDEAFVGIDQSMRGRCMGLLVALDLDFLMTSHDEWGCYEELPGVSIAQLYRDPNLDGVMAVFFTWNGRSLERARPPAGGGGG